MYMHMSYPLVHATVDFKKQNQVSVYTKRNNVGERLVTVFRMFLRMLLIKYTVNAL